MTVIIGHRAVGVSETKLDDFQKALDLGLEMIEFDVRMSKDGELVIFHGSPGMEGRNILRNKTLSEIRSESRFAPPKFTDVIDLCQGKILFDIEIKEHDILPDILKALGENREGHIITSFLDDVVFSAREGGMRAGLVLGMHGAGPRRRWSEFFPQKRMLACQADFLLPERRIYKLSPAKKIFENCIVWGANKEKDIERLLLDKKVEAIITDYPERASRIKLSSGDKMV